MKNLLLIIILLFIGCQPAPINPNNPIHVEKFRVNFTDNRTPQTIEKFKFENHQYLLIHKPYGTIIHDPNCNCYEQK